MAGTPPKFRLVAKNKQSKKSTQIGVLFAAQFPGAYNLALGAKAYGDSPAVEFVSLQLKVGGKSVTLTKDSHFLNMYLNEPKAAEGSDEDAGDDGEDEDF